MSIINLLKCESLQESKEEFRKVIQKAVDENDGPYFTVGLSGGGLPAILAEVLPSIQTDWQKWRFFFCDERLVSFSDPESTFGAYRSIVVPKIPDISLNQFITIDPTLNSWAAAYDYLSKMKQVFSRNVEIDFPRFDLLFLGMGPDGHTCSLFPGRPALNTKRWIAYVGDSPKPPPNRITMTLPVLNNAKYCVFFVAGATKAQVVKDIVVDGKQLPGGMVIPKNGELYWILDNESAKLLPEEYLKKMAV
ncbi:6-phosphogluconolactonase [Sarcoptes scabiei]|nr:6-phosphogluconolactonase [Sarcoptes scabiei]